MNQSSQVGTKVIWDYSPFFWNQNTLFRAPVVPRQVRYDWTLLTPSPVPPNLRFGTIGTLGSVYVADA